MKRIKHKLATETSLVKLHLPDLLTDLARAQPVPRPF